VASGAQIDVSAVERGDGGHIVIWGDQARVAGALTARGGNTSGNGGLIETSGHVIDVEGVSLSASAANGKGGEWLLDPYDITVSTGATTNINNFLGQFLPIGNSSVVSTAAINSVLNSGVSVTLTTANDSGTQAGNVRLANAITKTSGGNAALNVFANGTLSVESSITSTSGTLNIGLGSVGNMSMWIGTNVITSNGGLVALSAPNVSMTYTTVNTSGGRFTINNGAGVSSNVTLLGANINTGAGAIDITANNFSMKTFTGVTPNLPSLLGTTSGDVNINITRGSTSAQWQIKGSNITTVSGNISLLDTVVNATSLVANTADAASITSSYITTNTGNISIDAKGNVIGFPSGSYRLASIWNSVVAVNGTSPNSVIRINSNMTMDGVTSSSYRAALGLQGATVRNSGGSVNISGQINNVKVGGAYVAAIWDGGSTITANNVSVTGVVSVASSSNFFDTTTGMYWKSAVTGANSVNITGKVISPLPANYQSISLLRPQIMGGNISINSLKALSSSPNITSAAGIYSYTATAIGNASTQSINLTLAAGGTRTNTATLGNVTAANVSMNVGSVDGVLSVGNATNTNSSLSAALLSGVHTNNFGITASGNGTVNIVNLSTVTALNGTVGAANLSVNSSGAGTVAITGPVAGATLNVSAPNATIAVDAAGNITSSGNLGLTANNVTSAGTLTSTSGNVSLSGNTTNVTGGSITTGANGTSTIGTVNGTTSVSNVTVNGGNALLEGNSVTTSGNVSLNTTTDSVTGTIVTLGGNVTANNTLAVTGNNITSSANLTSTNGNVSLAGNTTSVTGGSITTGINGSSTIGTVNGTTSVSNVTVSGGNATLEGSSLATSGNVNLNTTNLSVSALNVNLGGNVTVNNTLAVTGDNVTSSANLTSTNGNVSLAGNTTSVTGGSITTGVNGSSTIGSASGTTSVSNVTVNGGKPMWVPAMMC